MILLMRAPKDRRTTAAQQLRLPEAASFPRRRLF
jgi:hypothetical protein